MIKQPDKKMSSDKAAPTHILVIDDDPIFRSLITHAGKSRNIEVTACSNLNEVKPMAVPKLFDAAIVDYYLEDFKSHLKGTHVACALEGTPILLVSQSNDCVEANEFWPSSIRKFVTKQIGVDRILDEIKTITEK